MNKTRIEFRFIHMTFIITFKYLLDVFLYIIIIKKYYLIIINNWSTYLFGWKRKRQKMLGYVEKICMWYLNIRIESHKYLLHKKLKLWYNWTHVVRKCISVLIFNYWLFQGFGRFFYFVLCGFIIFIYCSLSINIVQHIFQ